MQQLLKPGGRNGNGNAHVAMNWNVWQLQNSWTCARPKYPFHLGWQGWKTLNRDPVSLRGTFLPKWPQLSYEHLSHDHQAIALSPSPFACPFGRESFEALLRNAKTYTYPSIYVVDTDIEIDLEGEERRAKRDHNRNKRQEPSQCHL